MSTPDEVVADFLARGRSGGRLHPRYAELWDDLARTASGGKRFRPALLMAVHDLLGGTVGEVAAEVAGAVELLHTGFLMHDDVIDGDRTRHGRPNVSGSAAARARMMGADPAEERLWADTAGILAGDLALIGAVRTVALSGARSETVGRLLDLLDAAVHASAAGELRDVQLPLDGRDDATVAEVLAVAELKTAAYSFQLPLQAGAVLAGAADELVVGLGELGRLLGVAYQLQDDLLGMFGDEERVGKSVRSDLREGKRTPLIVHASSTSWWPTIASCVEGGGASDDEVALVRSTLEACGSRTFVEDLAERHLGAAWSLADEIGLPDSFLDDVVTLTRGQSRSVAA
ncbi:MAG: polyprenyl synthetase family protein [Propionibacteriaceae bacterium]